MSAFDLSVLFFLQMAFILGVCRIVGVVFKLLGQSQVVSEMIAGVVMGPSLMGWMFPGLSTYLFPADAKPILFAVAPLGRVLYMFLIGVEFDVGLIKSRLRSAASVSPAGIVGKGVACYAAARWHGESHREAMAVGTLMNARGLMELIILNIGLQRGIIEPALFAIMVMMAITTTLMATPIFERVYGSKASRAAKEEAFL